MKGISSCPNGKSTSDSAPLGSISHSEKVKGRLRFVFSNVKNFTELFKQKDSVLNTSVITAVTKSYIKPRSSTNANLHLHSSEERNVEQRRTNLVEP